MNADTTRRPLLPACATTSLMKWTRGLLKKVAARDSMTTNSSAGGDRCWENVRRSSSSFLRAACAT